MHSLGVWYEAQFFDKATVFCRYTRKNHFPGWARPFEFNANLYSSIGRNEEARDGVNALFLIPLY